MMTDWHSHILPGIDDGSASVEQSIAMLEMEAAQGVRRVIATPHFYPQHHTPERFLEKRNRAEDLLRQAMAGRRDLPEVLVGAEVYYFQGISESDALKDLTIRGTGCILIELPMSRWGEEIFRDLQAIWEKRGVIPVVAHIDRYVSPLRNRSTSGKLQQLPVLVQANGEFFRNRRFP